MNGIMENERVVIFVDGSNFYHSVKDTFQDYKKILNFDFEKFINSLKGNRKVVKICYYNPVLDKEKNFDTYRKQQELFKSLINIKNLELILCRMQKRIIDGKTSYTVKEDDIHLAVDMVRLADNNVYDTAILISTDGDFIPAVKAIKKIGKKVENISLGDRYSYHLKNESDKFMNISKGEIERFLK